jgi:hypothetical protein
LLHSETIALQINKTVNMTCPRGPVGLCVVLISSTEVYAKVEVSKIIFSQPVCYCT